MVTIEFLGPIKRPSLSLDIDNLLQLSDILKSNEDISNWLDTCAVAVNDIIVNDKHKILQDGDKISLLPPVCGG